MDHRLHISSLFSLPSQRGPDSISDLLRHLLEGHTWPWDMIKQLSVASTWAPISALPSSQRIQGQVASTARILSDDVVIAKHAVVEDYVVIRGPAWIGPYATVRTGAYLRSQILIEPYTVVGHATELKSTIMLPGAKAAHQCYVGDSILGQGVNLGAGTKTANLRFDKKNITILDRGTTIPTGAKKLGTIFGDRAQTGCNVVTNPGTIFLPHAVALPGKTISHVVSRTKVSLPTSP